MKRVNNRELALMQEMNARLKRIETSLDDVRYQAAKTGAVAGAVSGGVSGALVAAVVITLRAWMVH